jgi:hypothetical protein
VNRGSSCRPSVAYLDSTAHTIDITKGPAWFDEPTSTGLAHKRAECSNMGMCDRNTGRCLCREGFVGTACQVRDCPRDSAGAPYRCLPYYNRLILSLIQASLVVVMDTVKTLPIFLIFTVSVMGTNIFRKIFPR